MAVKERLHKLEETLKTRKRSPVEIFFIRSEEDKTRAEAKLGELKEQGLEPDRVIFVTRGELPGPYKEAQLSSLAEGLSSVADATPSPT